MKPLVMTCLAAASLALVAVPTLADKPAFHLKDGDGFRDLYHGDTPIYRHITPKHDPANHHDTYKHFHHLYGFHGEPFVTKGPGGKFTHHRGAFIGFSRTRCAGKNYDFWHCKSDVSIQHRRYLDDQQQLADDAATVVSVAEWVTAEGEVIVRETRRVTARDVAPGRYTLDFVFELQAVAGDVELGGDPQHAGFQLRADNSVAQTNMQYLRPATAKATGGDVWSACKWVAGRFTFGDHPYTLVHLSHPDNPEAVYSTRPYGRFGEFTRHAVEQGQTLTLKYRVVLLDADQHETWSVEAFDAMFHAYGK